MPPAPPRPIPTTPLLPLRTPVWSWSIRDRQDRAGAAGIVTLWKRNPDLVGWIEVPGTNINYPVVQSRTENYYLYNNFDEEVDYHGTIYVREVCDVFKPSDNLTIYGHHLIDGTMFHELDEFKKESFWREHKTFTFDTVSEHHTYEIVSVFLTTATLGEGFTYHEFVDAADAAEFDAYVAKCKEIGPVRYRRHGHLRR